MRTKEKPTEVWIRNPKLLVRECIEANQHDIIWNVSFLLKNRINVEKYMTSRFVGRPWRAIVVNENEASLIDHEHPSMDKPVAVWPVWRRGKNTIAELEEWAANPVGQNPNLYKNADIPRRVRPVKGQPERIIFVPGHAGDVYGKNLAIAASEIAEDYPDVWMHCHDTESMPMVFGLKFAAGDFHVQLMCRGGKIFLPNGKAVRWDTSMDWLEWIRLMGFYPRQLEIPRNRSLYSLRSLQWAGENFKENVKFRTRGFDDFDLNAPLQRRYQTKKPKGTIFLRRSKALGSDMLACNTCSRQMECKYYREGSVCSVPGSDGAELGEMFKSRDSDVIIGALGELLDKSARRVASALEHEDDTGTLLPATTAAINSLFDRGERLAKLVDPNLGVPDKNNAPANNFLQVNLGTPAQLAGAIIAELEGRGVPRDAITPEMVQQLMGEQGEARQKAIDTVAIEAGKK